MVSRLHPDGTPGTSDETAESWYRLAQQVAPLLGDRIEVQGVNARTVSFVRYTIGPRGGVWRSHRSVLTFDAVRNLANLA